MRINLQIEIDTSNSDWYFCEATQTANGLELSRTAHETKKKSNEIIPLENRKRKPVVFPIQRGKITDLKSANVETIRWMSLDENTAIYTSALDKVQPRNDWFCTILAPTLNRWRYQTRIEK